MKPSDVAIRTIRRDILATLGPRQGTPLRHDNIPPAQGPWCYWVQFYPFGFICDTFLHRLWMCEPWAKFITQNTDWVDIADMLCKERPEKECLRDY